jgi:hypothetical protein
MAAAIPAAMIAATARQNLKNICREFAATPIPVVVHNNYKKFMWGIDRYCLRSWFAIGVEYDTWPLMHVRGDWLIKGMISSKGPCGASTSLANHAHMQQGSMHHNNLCY